MTESGYTKVTPYVFTRSTIGPTLALANHWNGKDIDPSLANSAWHFIDLTEKCKVPKEAVAIDIRIKIVITNEADRFAELRGYIGASHDPNGTRSWEIHATAMGHAGTRQSWFGRVPISMGSELVKETGLHRQFAAVWFLWSMPQGSANQGYGMDLMCTGYYMPE